MPHRAEGVGRLEGIRQVSGSKPRRAAGSFEAVLNEARERSELKISAHAAQRLESRNIRLTEQHRQRIGEALERASEKGADQSLVLLDNLALVVSVKNRVVITALDDTKAREGVFTNIDSAVIA